MVISVYGVLMTHISAPKAVRNSNASVIIYCYKTQLTVFRL